MEEVENAIRMGQQPTLVFDTKLGESSNGDGTYIFMRGGMVDIAIPTCNFPEFSASEEEKATWDSSMFACDAGARKEAQSVLCTTCRKQFWVCGELPGPTWCVKCNSKKVEGGRSLCVGCAKEKKICARYGCKNLLGVYYYSPSW